MARNKLAGRHVKIHTGDEWMSEEVIECSGRKLRFPRKRWIEWNEFSGCVKASEKTGSQCSNGSG